MKFYYCEAHGKTWQIRDNLKRLGFRWNGKVWFCSAISEQEKASFERQLQDKRWLGVQFKFHLPLDQQGEKR